MLMLGGDEMEKLFDHVGKVTEDDTFKNALDKIENGIKGQVQDRSQGEKSKRRLTKM